MLFILIIWKYSDYLKKQFIEVAKGRPYEIIMKTKNIKTILPNYSAFA
jgi:hypothetical protein